MQSGKAKDFDSAEEPLQIGESITFREDVPNNWLVYAIKDDEVYIDGNNPGAGKTLHIWVKIVSVRPASRAELWNGQVLDEKIQDWGPCCP